MTSCPESEFHSFPHSFQINAGILCQSNTWKSPITTHHLFTNNYVIIQPFDATHLLRVPMKFSKWEMSLFDTSISGLQLTCFFLPNKSSHYSVWADIYRCLRLQKLISDGEMWFLFKFSLCQEIIWYVSSFFRWWVFNSTRIQNLHCVITNILELYFIQCKKNNFLFK